MVWWFGFGGLGLVVEGSPISPKPGGQIQIQTNPNHQLTDTSLEKHVLKRNVALKTTTNAQGSRGDPGSVTSSGRQLML